MIHKFSPEKLNEIVNRIVEVANPKKIILFGSAARGELGPHSDLDILVVVTTGQHRRRTAQQIYCRLIGVGVATDVIVVTENDLEQFKDHSGMVIRPALKEGKMLYAA